MHRYLWRDLAARPVLFPAVALCLGAWLGFGTPVSARQFLGASAGLALLAAAFSRCTGTHLAALAAFASAGAGLAQLTARTEVPNNVASGERIRLIATVEDRADFPDATRLLLAVSQVPDFSPPAARFRVILYGKRDGAPDIAVGSVVLLFARLKAVEAPPNPGQPDLVESSLRRGLLFTGTFEQRGVVELQKASAWRTFLNEFRNALAVRARRFAPTPEAASLYLTLAAGLRADIGDQLENEFAASGLAHVLSISGLHVAVLALLLLKSLRLALSRAWGRSRQIDVRRIASAAAIPAIWAYVALTGWQPPAVRSALMSSGLFVGMALWRGGDALNGLGYAAMAIVAVDPSSIASLSLQLSFLAVLSLILLAPAFRQWIPWERGLPGDNVIRNVGQRALESVIQTFCASAAVTVAALPLIATAFQRISLAGLISNIVCLPLCGVLTMLSAGGAAAFAVAPPLADAFFFVGTRCAALLILLVRLFAALPGASLSIFPFPKVASLLFFAGLLALAVGRRKSRILALAAPVGVAVALAPAIRAPDLAVTFLSVGQGDSIVVSSNGHHAIVDGGGLPTGSDTGRRFVLPFLRSQGIRSFDLAVLSHPHPDHAIGLASTVRAIPTRNLWVPDNSDEGEWMQLVIQAAHGAIVERVAMGRPAFQLGRAKVEVLGPPPAPPMGFTVNDRSVVLRITYRSVVFLLTGDIEEQAEDRVEWSEVTVLKAPHHGSDTSSSQRFVDQTRPRYVVFCVGRNNRFGFPHREVEQRYLGIGSQCFRTDIGGAIRFETDGSAVRVEPFLRSNPAGLQRRIAQSVKNEQTPSR